MCGDKIAAALRMLIVAPYANWVRSFGSNAPMRLERRLVRYTRKGVWGINGFYPARSFL
jgi:hypothetical protein